MYITDHTNLDFDSITFILYLLYLISMMIPIRKSRIQIGSKFQSLILMPTIDTNFETRLVVKIKLTAIWIQIGSNISDHITNANYRYQFWNRIGSKNKIDTNSDPHW